MDTAALAAGLLKGERRALAKAITLLESSNARDQEAADSLLTAIMPHCQGDNCLRLGISGIPGVGKSTFIASLGGYLLAEHPQQKIAILAVDPSSPIHGGSILGDKTRMEELAAHPSVFVRPSPNSGASGGVSRRSREVMLLMEAAGYPLVIIETVGVGQAEYEVAGMVDAFILLAMPATGDDLQGMKRGALELADLLVINKADGPLLAAAKISASQLKQAFTWLANGRPPPPVLLCSAAKKEGLRDIWQAVEGFISAQKQNAAFAAKRHAQAEAWFAREFEEALRSAWAQHYAPAEAYASYLHQVTQGLLPASLAARQLLQACPLP